MSAATDLAVPEGVDTRGAVLLGGTSTTGLPWPASTDPVNQGAANIKALADAVEARYQVFVCVADGSVPGTTLPAGGGTLGAASGLAIAAQPWSRMVWIWFKYTLGSVTPTSYVTFDLKDNAGTTVASARVNLTLQTNYLFYPYTVPPNTAKSWAVNMSSSGPASVYAANTGLSAFQYMVLGPSPGRGN